MTISGKDSSASPAPVTPLRRGFFFRARGIAAAASAFALVGLIDGSAWAQGDPKRGEYLAKAGGCVGCHTEKRKDAPEFAGGRALETPFGTFYGPNITSHPQAGLGRWTEADFIRAMRRGERPDGANYFPAFPYSSFTKISDEDLRHLWAYLRSLPPNSRPNQPHKLGFPYGFRPLVTLWKWLYFTPGPMAQSQPPSVLDRGAYVAQALGHCTECHTPRNSLGGLKGDRYLAGGRAPDGKKVPNLTPTRLKSWSDAELKEFLLTGQTPDGDSANETMAEVVANTTSKLTPGDLQALIGYLRSLPPLPNEEKDK